MRESIGYTVSLNIVIVFLTIVFAFLSAALIYYKSNKVNNIITETIEKYEGFNSLAENEINAKLTSIGYNKKPVNCEKYYNKFMTTLLNQASGNLVNGECYYNNSRSSVSGDNGYCVFYCREKDYLTGKYYTFYKFSTNMMINIPIINDILDIPIFSNTNLLYDFECQQDNC